MKPPLATEHADQSVSRPPLAVLSFVTLRKRADFLACARGRKRACPAFFLQARYRNDSDDQIRVGYTCSKKVGNAVVRNRAKRRLRALARSVLPINAKPGWDYVLVGKANATVLRNFDEMEQDLRSALKEVHK